MGKDLKGNDLGKGFGQRSDGLYYYRYTNRFGERTKPIYEKSLTKLKKKIKEENAKNDLNLNVRNNVPTLDEYFDIWINTYKKNTIKETTLKNYKETYKRYIYNTHLGKQRLNKVSIKDVKTFYDRFIDDGYSQTILGNLKTIIDGMYDTAVLDSYVIKNPFKIIKPVSQKKKKKVMPLTREEEELFLEYAKGNYYYNVFVFMFNTGLRAGEISGLLIDDVDIENRVLHVRHNLQYSSTGTFSNGQRYVVTTTKGDDNRDVPLNDATIKAYKTQLKLLEKIKTRSYNFKTHQKYKRYEEFDNLLFITTNGTPLNQACLTVTIQDIVERINIFEDCNMRKFGLHVLRHTFATRCLESDIDYAIIRDLLGHDDIKLTMKTYARANPFSKNVLEKINTI